MTTKTILVTGASSGIGLEVCQQLAAAGHTVHALARRADRLDALASKYPTIIPWPIDLRDETAVDKFAQQINSFDDIVHAAGGARGSAPVIAANSEHWQWMWQTNVLGTMYFLRSFAPRLVEQGTGTIVVVTSVAAFQAVEGSSGYSSTKHAQSAIVETLRNELLGTGVKVAEIAPGLVETEFLYQRFPDNPARAKEIYSGLDPLTAADIAAAITYVLSQPAHVNVDRIMLRPIAQAPNGKFHRR